MNGVIHFIASLTTVANKSSDTKCNKAHKEELLQVEMKMLITTLSRKNKH